MNITPLIKPSAPAPNQSATKIHKALEVPSINWGQDGFLPEIQADTIYPRYPVAAPQQVNATENKTISDEERFASIVKQYKDGEIDFSQMSHRLNVEGLITKDERDAIRIVKNSHEFEEYVRKFAQLEADFRARLIKDFVVIPRDITVSFQDIFSTLTEILDNIDNDTIGLTITVSDDGIINIPRSAYHRKVTYDENTIAIIERNRDFLLNFFAETANIIGG